LNIFELVKPVQTPDYNKDVLDPLAKNQAAEALAAQQAAEAAAQALAVATSDCEAQGGTYTNDSCAIPPPVVQQPVVVPAASTTYPAGCALYEPMVAAYSDWNVQIMMAIMQAESGCDPMAYNPSGCFGLFQVNGYGAIFDPQTNIADAHAKWVSRGYTPWTTYTSGAYLRFMQ
jgi:soluble lytic murein transglycosylase-like protein